MPLPGGAADKYGNRYEGLWTVQCMIRILKEEFISIHLEEPGKDGSEFGLVRTDGVTEFHQVKRQNGTEGHWRISDLKNRGVLDAFWKYSANPLNRFVFISTDNVGILPELIDRASKAHDWARFSTDFLGTSKKLQKGFTDIKNYVGAVTDETVFLRLKQLAIEPISEILLRRHVEQGISQFTNGNPANAVDILAQYALEQVNIELTHDLIIEHLKERHIFNSTGILLNHPVQYPLPQKPDHFISRAAILRTLGQRFSSDTRIVLVKGVDGAGKTTLLTQFIEDSSANCFYFFVGRDWTSNTTSFMRDMCRQFQNVLGENNSLDELRYDDLRDRFGRLCREIARLGCLRSTPYYIVVDGLENVREEPGRESILDLIELDFNGLFILGSTNHNLPLRLSHFVENLDYFTPADTEKYLADLSITSSQAEYVYRISEGLPAYLDQLRREIEGGKQVTEVLNNLPKTLHDLLERDWETRSHSPEEQSLLAMLAHAEMSFNVDLLSTVTNLSKSQVQQILDNTQFVELHPTTHVYRFITEAHRSFVAKKLVDSADHVNETLISYYQQDIFSEESLERLPLLLHIRKNKYDSLKSLININYLAKSLSITHDMSLVRRNSQLMLDAASGFGEEKDLSTISKFSLIGSLLKTFTEESADKLEVQALLAIGEYQKSVSLAYQAPLLEDKLELLSVIGKELKHNDGSLLENVVLELERLIADVTPNVVIKERAVDIATDLFVVDPQAALDLLEKVADTDGKFSTDILLAVLALRLESDKQSIPDTFKSRIANEKLREFITANSPSISELTAEEAIMEAEKIKQASGQLFLLRSWCNENRDNPEAIKVTAKVIEIIQEAPPEGYSPSMLHLRQFAEPLAQYEYDKVSRIIEIFRDIKAASLQQPFEEAIRLELILLKLEAKNSKEKMHEQLLDLYLGLEQLQDLDVLCYCYVQILVKLGGIDPNDEMNLSEEIRKLLPEKFNQLLLGSSDQYKVSERILRTLAKYDHELALEFAKRLNTSSRRNDAYSEVIRMYVSKIDTLSDPTFLNNILNLVSDLEHQNQIIVLLLRTFAEKFDLQNSPAVENFIVHLEQVEDPVDLSYGFCYACNLLIKSGYGSKAEEYFNKMKIAWTQIELLPERVDVGFDLVIALSEQNVEKARQFYEIVSNDQKTHPLSNGTLLELYANLLDLSIRSIIAFKGRPEFEDRLGEIITNIDEIPSQTLRASHYADLCLRFHIYGLNQYSRRILEEKILPLTESCENVVDQRNILGVVAPVLFHVARDRFNQAIVQHDIGHDDIIFNVIVQLISKQVPGDPIDLQRNNFIIDNATATEVCGLIELLATDEFIHSSIKLLVNASIYDDPKPYNNRSESCRLSEPTALLIARRLATVISNKLPDSRNIQHDGYKILCYGLLGRLRDVVRRAKTTWGEIVPNWDDIITQARDIPNLPDRILVLSCTSSMLKKHDEALAKRLVAEAQDLVYSIPNVIGRSDSLTDVAQAWHDLDDHQASRYLLSEAMKIIEGLSWDESKDRVAAQILQAAHAIDPVLASSLTSVIDNPLIQHRLKDKVLSKDLFREPHKLDLDDDMLDYGPVVSAAYEITRAMISGTYHSLLDSSIIHWLTVSSRLPFAMSFPFRLLEIQNYVGGSQAYIRSANLAEVYANLLDGLKLIGLVSTELYHYDFSNLKSRNIPKSLRTIPIDSKDDFTIFITNWMAEENAVDTLEIYDREFTHYNLDCVLTCAKSARVNIFTTWAAQGLSLRDISISDLFRNAWFELSEDVPYDLRISLFETETGQSPLENRLYILNRRKGLEIITNRNYLEKAYLHIRELTVDEVHKYADDYLQKFLISPILSFRDEKVTRRTIQID
jgi:hypothetical protein